MEQFVEKLQVDANILLRRRKIREKQVSALMDEALSSGGYSVYQDIFFGYGTSFLVFEEMKPDDEGKYLVFVKHVKKDNVFYLALYHPFLRVIYVVKEKDFRFVRDVPFGKAEFLLGYQMSLGCPGKKYCLQQYRLRCRFRLGWLWGGLTLKPTAVVVYSFGLDDRELVYPLSKLFVRMAKENTPDKEEYAYRVPEADFLARLFF